MKNCLNKDYNWYQWLLSAADKPQRQAGYRQLEVSSTHLLLSARANACTQLLSITLIVSNWLARIIATLIFNNWLSFNIPKPQWYVLQFDAEFRRFGLSRSSLPTFDGFTRLLEEIHKLSGSSFTVAYTDPEGDLLPITNNENYAKALTTAQPMLRVFVHRKGELCGKLWLRVILKDLFDMTAFLQQCLSSLREALITNIIAHKSTKLICWKNSKMNFKRNWLPAAIITPPSVWEYLAGIIYFVISGSCRLKSYRSELFDLIITLTYESRASKHVRVLQY